MPTNARDERVSPPAILEFNDDRHRLRRSDSRLLRDLGGPGAVLCRSPFQRGPVMNWVYWLSGFAALLIFVYLIVALFKPEHFE
jgi:K+-transporting ATPase KdpF subunit